MMKKNCHLDVKILKNWEKKALYSLNYLDNLYLKKFEQKVKQSKDHNFLPL